MRDDTISIELSTRSRSPRSLIRRSPSFAMFSETELYLSITHRWTSSASRDGRRASKLRLAMEDWGGARVTLTNVQLFEGLHSNRPSRCRRLHNLARSVLILDEAQTIPLPLLRPLLAAINELSRNYGASVVLYTATQPAVAAPQLDGGLPLYASDTSMSELNFEIGRGRLRRRPTSLGPLRRRFRRRAPTRRLPHPFRPWWFAS